MSNGTDAATQFLNDAQEAIDFSFAPKVVLPGDDVTDLLTKNTKRVKLGAGLRQQGENVVATNAGVLRYRPANRYWVDFHHKRYVPCTDDSVIGIVTDRNPDFYRVNIGAASTALLGTMAFDGATKRNRPNLRIGSIVYARISRLPTASEIELTCQAPSSLPKKDWMTGLAIYSELSDGYVIQTSINLAKNLLQEDSAVLSALGKKLAFELAVGMNGIVWINSSSNHATTIISNAILNSEHLTEAETHVMVQQLMENLE